MPNKADTPMNSRMLVIEFEPLESTETPDVDRWSDLKYLLSSIAPDIYDLFLTKERKLDKNALDDCASYLEQLTGLDILRKQTESVDVDWDDDEDGEEEEKAES